MDGCHGGKIHVPDKNSNRKLLEAHGIDCEGNIPIYLVEYITDVFRFHLDLDAHEKEPIDLDRWTAYARVIQEEARRFYPNMSDEEYSEVFRMCISMPEHESKLVDKKDGVAKEIEYKSCAHLNFPNLLVSLEQALQIRAGCVARLASVFGEPSLNYWHSVVDYQTLANNKNLRLVGSRKCEDCHNCKDKRGIKEECNMCHGYHKIDKGRLYELKTIIDGEGNEEKDAVKKMRGSGNYHVKRSLLLSVRSYEKEPTRGFERYTGAPSYVVAPKGRTAEVSKKNYFNALMKQDGSRAHGNSRRKDILLNSSQAQCVEALVRSFHPYYKDTFLSRLTKSTFKDTNKSCYTAFVRGTGMNCCLNLDPKGSKKGQHGSHNVYFCITAVKGIRQKCFCKCDKGDKAWKERISGKLCKDFESRNMYLQPDVLTLLFPDHPSANGISSARSMLLSSSEMAEANAQNQKVGEEILLQILGKRNTDVLTRRISSSQMRRTQMMQEGSSSSSSSSNKSARSNLSNKSSSGKRSIQDVKDAKEIKDDPFLSSALKKQKTMIEKFGKDFIHKNDPVHNMAQGNINPSNMFEFVRNMRSEDQKQNVMCPLLPPVEQRKTISFMAASENNQ